MRGNEDNRRFAGICFNLRKNSGTDDDEEYDEPETIEFLSARLENFGFRPVLLEQDEYLLEKLNANDLSFVFNIAEGKGKTRSREAQVPCLLEWLDIPYYGSDPAALSLTLDKWLTHVFLKHAGIPVPKAVTVESAEELEKPLLEFKGNRYIVKPRWEGSSKGIFNDSLVDSARNCRNKAEFIIRNYNQPVLIEEFIDGDEITAGVVGNETPEILGMMRISRRDNAKNFIYSLENKRDWREKIKYERADEAVSKEVLDRAGDNALAAFRALGLRDAARIDFRVDKTGVPKIIDINPLPGLSPHYSDLMIISRLHGRDFTEVVDRIIEISLLRNGINVS